MFIPNSMSYQTYTAMKSIRFKYAVFCGFLFSCIILSLTSLSLLAQPSGGPYGPLEQVFEIPDVSGQIYYVKPDGRAELHGLDPEIPTSLEKAVAKAKTGDAIILRGGVYRIGDLMFNQGIVFQAYRDEHPVLKGSYIAKDWEQIHYDTWVISWPHLFPGKPFEWWEKEKEEKNTPLHRFNNDMVFIDGNYLQSAGSVDELDSNSFYVDYSSQKIYMRIDPAGHTIEITAFKGAFHRLIKACNGMAADHKGPVFRGIEFSQYAETELYIEGTDPQGISKESEHGKQVIGTVLEHCSFSDCGYSAGYLFGDSLIVRHCKVSRTSIEGLFIVASSDILLEKNIFSENNIEHITGIFPATVKIFNQCYRAVCRDNLITNLPNSNGIWYDVGNVDGIIVNNRFENVGNVFEEYFEGKIYWSALFYEISKGAFCMGNAFINCDNGVMILNSSDVEVYHNTFINSVAVVGRDGRNEVSDRFGWHPSTGPKINERDGHVFKNNLLVTEAFYKEMMLIMFQPDTLCEMLRTPQFREFDFNVYVWQSFKDSCAANLWSPGPDSTCTFKYRTPEELHEQLPQFDKHSHYLTEYKGPLFKDRPSIDLRLVPEFQGAKVHAELPDRVKRLINFTNGKLEYIGAFPLVENK